MDEYEKRAQGLEKYLEKNKKQHPLLQAVKAAQCDHRPFIVVDGSSGTGKTQSAFLLKGFVMYFLLMELSDTSQVIYRSVKEISNAFYNCLVDDINEFRFLGSAEEATREILNDNATTPLRSAGLLLEIGRRMFESGPSEAMSSGVANFAKLFWDGPAISAPRASIAQVKKFFIEMALEHSAFCVVLDEVPPVSPKAITVDSHRNVSKRVLISFARNLFRSMRSATTIMMGTDSTIANMIGTRSDDNGSRSDDKPVLWAIVVVNLPPCVPRLLNDYENAFLQLENPQMFSKPLRRFLKNQLRVCRPWVAGLICSFVANVSGAMDDRDRLTALVEFTARKLFAAKWKKLLSVHGRFATITMLSACTTESAVAATMKSYNINTATTFSVTSHFATPVVSSNEVFLNSMAALQDGNENPWTCSYAFPFQEKVLFMALTSSMYCLLIENKKHIKQPQYAVANEGLTSLISRTKRQSVRQALMTLHQTGRLTFCNPLSEKNSGSTLEGVSAAAVLLATHHKFEPTPLPEFVRNILLEFDIDVPVTILSPFFASDDLSAVEIPYLLFPESTKDNTRGGAKNTVAQLLKKMGIPTSVYYRPADVAGVDGSVVCDKGRVLVECKDWASEIDSTCLSKIASRCAAYQDARIILVICGMLQGSYNLEEGSWAAETSFLRVEMDGEVARVAGLPNPTAPKRVMMLVAVNTSETTKKSKRARQASSSKPPRKRAKRSHEKPKKDSKASSRE